MMTSAVYLSDFVIMSSLSMVVVAHVRAEHIQTRESAASASRSSAVAFQRLVDDEKIRQQGSKVYRCVQIVDELRADALLREHQAYRTLCLLRVLFDRIEERGRRIEPIFIALPHTCRDCVTEALQR